MLNSTGANAPQSSRVGPPIEEKNANLRHKAVDDTDALHLAVIRGETETANWLIGQGMVLNPDYFTEDTTPALPGSINTTTRHWNTNAWSHWPTSLVSNPALSRQASRSLTVCQFLLIANLTCGSWSALILPDNQSWSCV